MDEKNLNGKAPNAATEEKKLEILESYVELVRAGSLFPTRADMLGKGITRDVIRHHFINMARLRAAAKDEFPDDFRGVLDIERYTSKSYLAKLDRTIAHYKRFVITTSVSGQRVHQGFLDSIQNYCKIKDAALLLIPCHDPAHNLDNEIEWHMDDALIDYGWVFSRLDMNSNVHVSDIRVTAKQINPTTGLGRFVQGQGSAIFGSPKQSLEFIPVSNIKYPHALMSTGAITLPNYKTTRGNSLRTAWVADHDHKIGAIIVEVQDDKLYHFRQIQSDENGGFCDLGRYYFDDTVTDVTSTLVIGDYHAGQHSETAQQAWIELASVANVTEVIMHDLHNGLSTNHHDAHKMVTQARRAAKGQLDAKRELGITGSVLNLWTSLVHKVTVTKSNHDEFLERWLDEARFAKDPYNFQLGCVLAAAMVDGKDPLIVGLDLYGNLKNPEKINWLKRDQDYRVFGIENGAHGDKGPNGAKGSKASLERAYGSATIAHSHTAGILREVFQVGTTSLFDLEYNSGPSSWMHCSCLEYWNGQRQLINSINGEWHLK
jgi:hypothetical protein